MSACTCYATDPKTWTTYGSAVEPGSQWEHNPDCPEHFPRPAAQEPAVTTTPMPWQGYCWPSLGEPCGECHRCTK